MDNVDFEGERKSRTITIESPMYLEEAQNIFDQQPFSGLINKIVEKQEKPIEDVIRVLSGIINIIGSLDSPSFSQEEINGFARKSSQIDSYSSLSTSEKLWRYKIGRVMLQFLNKYPYWANYIHGHGGGTYMSTGKPRNQVSDFKTESYGYWVSKKLVRERKLVAKGIEDIFGLTGEGKRLGEYLPRPRKWRILHSSEISRKV